jgi:hypothetical protein
MVYVGLDVHRKRTQVAILDDAGKQPANRNVTNDPGGLMPVLATLDPETPVAFESAYGWGWVAELLDDLGLEPHLAHGQDRSLEMDPPGLRRPSMPQYGPSLSVIRREVLGGLIHEYERAA